VRILVVAGRRRLGALLAATLIILAWVGLCFTAAPGRGPRGGSPLAGHLIALDAGHGGIDGGASYGPWLEKDLALDLVLRLRPLLHEGGARVFLTRERDHDLSSLGEGSFRQRRDLAGRVMLVRRSGAEILLSVHLNSALTPQLSGPITFHQEGREESRRLAGLVQEELRALYPGCAERAWPHTFYLLRNSPVPTALAEVGFLSHLADRLRLLDPDFRRRLAASFTTALRRYFAGEPYQR
jgi:N-acetylmuramoyl-L-alanine amidase